MPKLPKIAYFWHFSAFIFGIFGIPLKIAFFEVFQLYFCFYVNQDNQASTSRIARHQSNITSMRVLKTVCIAVVTPE